ncbi:MAG: hypothetical protein PUB42_00095 [Firmicutes bacterium]|nr:hypothetical protein [Bacillota bacterium]
MFNRCLKRQLIYITTSKRVCQYLFLSFFDFFNSGIARSFGQLVHFTTFFSFCQYLFLFFYIIKSFTICAKVKNPQAVPPVREAAASRTLFFAKKKERRTTLLLADIFPTGDRKHFEEQYNSGAALPDIADTLGVHISTIYR